MSPILQRSSWHHWGPFQGSSTDLPLCLKCDKTIRIDDDIFFDFTTQKCMHSCCFALYNEETGRSKESVEIPNNLTNEIDLDYEFMGGSPFCSNLPERSGS